MVTASYFIESMEGVKVRQQNVFGFVGNANVCFEIHISKTSYQPSDDLPINARLAAFLPEPSYTPAAKDYFLLATLLFRRAPGSAAPYYRSALTAIPVRPDTLRNRRIVTDRLAMSLGMNGQLKESRTVLNDAISSDPEYPLNYYNLACADAEQGNAPNATLHLQQAFDRRARMLQGESFPDPTKDDSLLKLKRNKEFWTLATSISANMK